MEVRCICDHLVPNVKALARQGLHAGRTEVGALLRSARENQGLTIDELGRHSGAWASGLARYDEPNR